MKNWKLLLVLAAFLVTTQGVTKAIQTVNTNEQININKNVAVQVREKSEKEKAMTDELDAKFNEIVNRLYGNVRTCEQFHWHEYIDFFGLKFGFKIDIDGWVDNKCMYNLSGQVGSLGKDVREVFEVKIPDELIARLEPKFQCNFTREQLDIIADALKAYNSQNESVVRNIMKSSKAKAKNQKLTPEEERLVSLLTTEGACRLLNQDDLMEAFTEALKYIFPEMSEMPELPNE